MLNLQRLVSTTHSAARHRDGVLEHGLVKGIFIWSFAFEGTLGIERGNWDGNMALSGLVVNGWRKYSDHPRRNDCFYGLFYKRVDSTYVGSPFGWFPIPLDAFLGGNYWGRGPTTSLIFRTVFYWRGTVCWDGQELPRSSFVLLGLVFATRAIWWRYSAL